jgi:uncharacterized repeat protein (TIGR04138 family)
VTEDEIDQLVDRDPSYRREAYLFALDGLEFTVHRLGRAGHVTGRELLYGLRDLALERFGPMAATVFEHWGVRTTDDFGRIVFALVEVHRLSRRDEDTLEEFHDVFDFAAEFEHRHGWLP